MQRRNEPEHGVPPFFAVEQATRYGGLEMLNPKQLAQPGLVIDLERRATRSKYAGKSLDDVGMPIT